MHEIGPATCHQTCRPPAVVISVSTLVVGAGQAGLSTGYYLREHGESFQIVDAGQRVGDSWRQRWSSLRLFTPSGFNALPQAPWPGSPGYFPGKDEVADYLEHYAQRFALPIRFGARLSGLRRHDGGFVAQTAVGAVEARRVVMATGPYVDQKVPAFAAELDPAIVQLTSTAYQQPAALPAGPVLVVGAGNSGAEIALELAASRRTILAGPDTGHVPIRIGPGGYRMLQRMTLDTRSGRMLARYLHGKGHPVVRAGPRLLRSAGVLRCGRVAGVDGGQPVVPGVTLPPVESVVWCTGFSTAVSWSSEPEIRAAPLRHRRGVATDVAGLYFVGLPFQYSATSHLLGGVAADARYVVERLVAQSRGQALDVAELNDRD